METSDSFGEWSWLRGRANFAACLPTWIASSVVAVANCDDWRRNLLRTLLETP